jgi:hypothetical protein
MKAIAYILAMASSLAVAVTVTFANPAMMKKDRPGYLSADTTATNLYGSEALEAAVANEPKDAYPENLTSIPWAGIGFVGARRTPSYDPNIKLEERP